MRNACNNMFSSIQFVIILQVLAQFSKIELMYFECKCQYFCVFGNVKQYQSKQDSFYWNYCCMLLQLNQLKMYSFINANSQSNPQQDNSNPQSSLSSKQRLPHHRNENTMEFSNEIQTPNFNDLHNNLNGQDIFDTYHCNFSEKNNQLSKLINTFEDLGLDIEYLEESDAQSQSNADTKRQEQRKSSYNIEEELNYAVSSTNIPQPIYKLSSKQKQHLQNIKNSLKSVKLVLNSFLQSLNFFQKECRSIFSSSHNYFTKCLQKFYKKNVLVIEENKKENLSIRLDQQQRRHLQRIISEKQEKIRSLVKEKEYLSSQNYKLHSQMESISSKYKKAGDLQEENHQIIKLLSNYQIKNRQLQLYINEQSQKIDDLQWRLSQSKQLYKISNYQNRNIRPELQRKYEKMFQQAVSEMKHKIQAQTYHKFKYNYPFHYDHFQEGRIIETTSRFYDGEQDPIDIKLNLIQKTQSFKEQAKHQLANQKESQHLKLSLPYNKKIVQSVHLQTNSHKSTIQSNRIELQEKRAEEILRDIRKMKSSRALSPSLSSSIKRLPYYPPRRNDYRA